MTQSDGQHAIDSACKVIRQALERAKADVYAQIRNYPPPITACDEQFDLLIESRDRIVRSLHGVDELVAACSKHPDPAALIADFVAASPDVEDCVREQIRTLLT